MAPYCYEPLIIHIQERICPSGPPKESETAPLEMLGLPVWFMTPISLPLECSNWATTPITYKINGVLVSQITAVYWGVYKKEVCRVGGRCNWIAPFCFMSPFLYLGSQQNGRFHFNSAKKQHFNSVSHHRQHFHEIIQSKNQTYVRLMWIPPWCIDAFGAEVKNKAFVFWKLRCLDKSL